MSWFIQTLTSTINLLTTHPQSAPLPWFPKISELRAIAARLANTAHFETLAPEPALPILPREIWPLICQAQPLEDAFYNEGVLDPAAWHSLADVFTAANRPHRAAHVLEKQNDL